MFISHPCQVRKRYDKSLETLGITVLKGIIRINLSSVSFIYISYAPFSYYWQDTYDMLRINGNHCTRASFRCYSYNVASISSCLVPRAILHQFNRMYFTVISINKSCKMVTSLSLTLHSRPLGHVTVLKTRIQGRDPDASYFQLLRTSSRLFLSSHRKPHMNISNGTIGFRKFRHYEPLLFVSVNELGENGGNRITFGCVDTIATKYTSGEWEQKLGHEPSL